MPLPAHSPAATKNGPDRRARGPRHRHPAILRFTAVMHLLNRILFVVALAGVPWVLLSQDGDLRPLVYLPAALLVGFFLWLWGASRVGCRVCGMRMFYNRKCAKSPKVPSIPLLGPHTTLAIRALFSSAVRCPYCGTPNELSRAETRPRPKRPEDY